MIKYKCKINHINEEQDFLRGGETEEEEKNQLRGGLEDFLQNEKNMNQREEQKKKKRS